MTPREELEQLRAEEAALSQQPAPEDAAPQPTAIEPQMDERQELELLRAEEQAIQQSGAPPAPPPEAGMLEGGANAAGGVIEDAFRGHVQQMMPIMAPASSMLDFVANLQQLLKPERVEEGKGVRDFVTSAGVKGGTELLGIPGWQAIAEGVTGGTPDVEAEREMLTMPTSPEEEAVGQSLASGVMAADQFLDENLPVYTEAKDVARGFLDEYAENSDAVAQEFGPAAGAYRDTALRGAELAIGGVGGQAIRSGLRAIPKLPKAPLTQNQQIAGMLARGDAEALTAGKTLASPAARSFGPLEDAPPPRWWQLQGTEAKSSSVPIAGQSWSGKKDIVMPSGRPGVTGKAVKDKIGIAAVKQDIEEGSVASMKSANPTTRRLMNKMLDTVERVEANKVVGYDLRASDVLGDSLHKRFRIIKRAKQDAGVKLERAADALRKVDVDPSPALNKFLRQMKELGVHIDAHPSGPEKLPSIKIDPNSRLASLPGLERQVHTLFKKMRDATTTHIDGTQRVFKLGEKQTMTGWELHNFKQGIDDLVEWGSGQTKEGLGANIERIAKDLRHGVNKILREKHKPYAEANVQWSEATDVINALQGLLGKKIPLTGPGSSSQLGTIMRAISSNRQGRTVVRNVANKLERVAQKYKVDTSKALVPHGAKTEVPLNIDDDIRRLTIMVDDIEKAFGPKAANSFQGQISQAIEANTRLMTGAADPAEEMVKLASKAVGKGKKITHKTTMKALRELLKDGN